jgi:hypothetical protein
MHYHLCVKAVLIPLSISKITISYQAQLTRKITGQLT